MHETDDERIALLYTLTAAFVRQCPQLERRAWDAMKMVVQQQIVVDYAPEPGYPGVTGYKVASRSHPDTWHQVKQEHGVYTCTCPDSAPLNLCAHRIAVRMMVRADTYLEVRTAMREVHDDEYKELVRHQLAQIQGKIS